VSDGPFVDDDSVTLGGVEELGIFSAAELRAGGINGRGFFQPILPAPEGVDPVAEGRRVSYGLADRGLLLRHGLNWAPIGRFGRILDAVAAARSVVNAESGPGRSLPRLAFGRLGDTDRVLDLEPAGGVFRARLTDTRRSASSLAGYLGLAGLRLATAVEGRAVTEADPAWTRVESMLADGTVLARVETATVERPEVPVVQQRMSVVSCVDGYWFLLGTRRGSAISRTAAPGSPGKAERMLSAMLRGSTAEAPLSS
jgi:hypothetical protein